MNFYKGYTNPQLVSKSILVNECFNELNCIFVVERYSSVTRGTPGPTTISYLIIFWARFVFISLCRLVYKKKSAVYLF